MDNNIERMRSPYIIGVCGASGSGKTSFVRAMAERLGEDNTAVLAMDNYYLPIEQQPKDAYGVENFDCLESFDIDKFEADVATLRRGEVVTKSEHVFNNENKRSRVLTIEPAPILIIEGLFIYNFPFVTEACDLKLYVEAHDHIRLIRRIKRDLTERNYQPEMVMHQWEHHVYPAYKKYIETSRDLVDLIINNNQGFQNSIEIIASYVLRAR